MRRGKAAPALVLVVLAIALAVVIVALRRANDWLEGLPSLAGDCGEERLQSVSSPDGKYVATLFEQNCGATSPFSYHVNLRETNHTFIVGERAMIQDGIVFDCTHINGEITMTWKGPRKLLIKHPRGDIFQQAPSWRDVTIIYQPCGKKPDPNFPD